VPATTLPNSIAAAIWALAARQHGVVARYQLLEIGMHRRAIDRRIRSGRLHVARGVYAVGRPQLTQQGLWMVAILSCGPAAALSHSSAAASDGFGKQLGMIEVSVPLGSRPRRRGIRVHRIARSSDEITIRNGIPATIPVVTLIDIAVSLPPTKLERAVNDADKLGLCTPDQLRAALERWPGRQGTRALRELLDRRTFALTDSQLERRFLPIARAASLPKPQTGRRINGFRVDFFWSDLGLVVETDGLTYHRTPSAQTRDRLRDQAHTAAGMTPVRFTHEQVRYQPAHVERILRLVADRLRERMDT